ncbi:hypothetical protein MOV75_09250, partial [Bradyrhizobium sp. PRIMUS42]|nr:hypothetical protein [Bradyrhizobium sp. PRIMUS42]
MRDERFADPEFAPRGDLSRHRLGCGLTITMLTSGWAGGAADTAELDSSQPASSGARAASIIATHADRARSPDMKWGAPILLKLIMLRARPVLGRFARG